MAVGSLFWNTNMAAVTSRENVLLPPSNNRPWSIDLTSVKGTKLALPSNSSTSSHGQSTYENLQKTETRPKVKGKILHTTFTQVTWYVLGEFHYKASRQGSRINVAKGICEWDIRYWCIKIWAHRAILVWVSQKQNQSYQSEWSI